MVVLMEASSKLLTEEMSLPVGDIPDTCQECPGECFKPTSMNGEYMCIKYSFTTKNPLQKPIQTCCFVREKP